MAFPEKFKCEHKINSVLMFSFFFYCFNESSTFYPCHFKRINITFICYCFKRQLDYFHNIIHCHLESYITKNNFNLYDLNNVNRHKKENKNIVKQNRSFYFNQIMI